MRGRSGTPCPDRRVGLHRWQNRVAASETHVTGCLMALRGARIGRYDQRMAEYWDVVYDEREPPERVAVADVDFQLIEASLSPDERRDLRRRTGPFLRDES